LDSDSVEIKYSLRPMT